MCHCYIFVNRSLLLSDWNLWKIYYLTPTQSCMTQLFLAARNFPSCQSCVQHWLFPKRSVALCIDRDSPVKNLVFFRCHVGRDALDARVCTFHGNGMVVCCSYLRIPCFKNCFNVSKVPYLVYKTKQYFLPNFLCSCIWDREFAAMFYPYQFVLEKRVVQITPRVHVTSVI